MEGAIKTVVSVFLKSAKGKENLGGKEFQALVKNQLKNIMTDAESSEAVKQMRQGLDANNDGKVSFQEYMTLIGYLSQALSQQRCNEENTPAVDSVQETQAEAPAAAKAEPKMEKAADPVKEEVVGANVNDEAEDVEEKEEKENGEAAAEDTS